MLFKDFLKNKRSTLVQFQKCQQRPATAITLVVGKLGEPLHEIHMPLAVAKQLVKELQDVTEQTEIRFNRQQRFLDAS